MNWFDNKIFPDLYELYYNNDALCVVIVVCSLLSQQSDETQVLKVLGLMVNLSSSKEVSSVFYYMILKFLS